MNDYLLFIDTEASGEPKHWDAAYIKDNNWPYCIQISWIVFDKTGKEIKSQDHYINDNISIDPESFKIHKISTEFLTQHGELRKEVMSLLANDIIAYQPLLIGHFMELDMHMIDADFRRAGIENPTAGLPTFCTMKYSSEYVNITNKKYLRLSELYGLLFDRSQPDQHNALSDSRAAAECFFELVKRGKITDRKIAEQQEGGIDDIAQKVLIKYAVIGIVLFIIVIILIIAYHGYTNRVS